MKNKFSIPTLSKQLFFALACGIIFYGCESSANNGGSITQSYGFFKKEYDLQEVEYKGHTYIYCEVRDGIAMTHAGHCKCNSKK